MIRSLLSAVAGNPTLGDVLSRAPLARDVVNRVVGGEELPDALATATGLADEGFLVSLERSGSGAEAVLADYADLVVAVADSGLAGVAEVAVIPAALASDDGAATAQAFARLDQVAELAEGHGVALMVGMGRPDDVEATLDWVADRPVGVTLAACLRRTERDCERMGDRRVRLVKGAYRAQPPVTYSQPAEIDKAFVRCARRLVAGSGAASFATHDPRLLAIVADLAARSDRDVEYAFYLGRARGEQERLRDAGARVRIYVPYGPEWFERIVAGLAERPASIGAAVRSLLPGG